MRAVSITMSTEIWVLIENKTEKPEIPAEHDLSL
jgi:hypothetical protein